MKLSNDDMFFVLGAILTTLAFENDMENLEVIEEKLKKIENFEQLLSHASDVKDEFNNEITTIACKIVGKIKV